ncbi:uncharacterized protein [Choristoneura fumiferana]|uniref:uncharacterized protein n=1 Tax=Choristoneura fumiferana TaxID=7141 RepID=UPI003D153A56
MYRVLLILALINLVEPHRWCTNHPSICQRHHRNYYKRHQERSFERLANDIIEADNKVKSFCSNDQETKHKEVYGEDIYKLVITLPNFNESAIEVKIKHRVIFVKAIRENEYKEYVNVKILPELVNASGATWYYGNEELTVAVPYKVAVKTEAFVTCGDEINVNVIEVPKTDEDITDAPQIDVRFADIGAAVNNANITENVVY